MIRRPPRCTCADKTLSRDDALPILMVLRRCAPQIERLFRCPAPYVVGTAAVLGCIYLLISLPSSTIVRFIIWNLAGLAIYFAYGRWRSARQRATVAA